MCTCPLLVGGLWSTVVVARPIKLSDRQVAVLSWIGDGCPRGAWPDEGHKNMARALAGRGLVEVGREKKVWTATITSAGEYYLEYGRPEPRGEVDLETGGDAVRDASRLARGQPRTDHPSLDATSRAMRGVASPRRPRVVTQSQREIKEMFMRYKVVVTRVQVAERFVRATSEEDAAEKVQAEFDRQYGYFGCGRPRPRRSRSSRRSRRR
jgi:hypothetical protein